MLVSEAPASGSLKYFSSITLLKKWQLGARLYLLFHSRQHVVDTKAIVAQKTDRDVAMTLLCRISAMFKHKTLAIGSVDDDEKLTLEFFNSTCLKKVA